VDLWAQPLAWVVAGLAIVLIDVFLGMVLLPFAVAAGLVAVATFVDRQGWLASLVLVPSWQVAAIAYGVLVVVGYVVVRVGAGRGAGGRRDVNDY
jgi:membrane protein implicated in regulation of membrane protease activity